MRQVRDVLRLKTAGVAINEIARRVGVAPSTVRLTLKQLAVAGLNWPLPVALTDTALEARLFTEVGTKQGHRRRAEPDWGEIHRELKRKTSRCRSCGTSTSSGIPTGTATRGFASCTAPGRRGSRSRWGRPMPAATSCSSITPATRCR